MQRHDPAAPADTRTTPEAPEAPEAPQVPARRRMPATAWAAVAATTATTALGVAAVVAGLPGRGDLTPRGLESYATPAAVDVPAVGGLVAVVFALVTIGLLRRSRLARAWTAVGAVLLLVAAASGLLAPGLVLATGLAVAASGLLVLSPGARSWFAAAPARPVPTSLAVVRVSLLVPALFWFLAAVAAGAAALLVVDGLGDGRLALRLNRPIAEVTGLVVPVLIGAAALCLVVGVLYLWLRAALGRGSRVARVLATILFAGHAVGLVTSVWTGTTAVALALQVVLLIALWVPSDARRRFGGQALPVVEDWHRRLLGGGGTTDTGHGADGSDDADTGEIPVAEARPDQRVGA